MFPIGREFLELEAHLLQHTNGGSVVDVGDPDLAGKALNNRTLIVVQPLQPIIILPRNQLAGAEFVCLAFGGTEGDIPILVRNLGALGGGRPSEGGADRRVIGGLFALP